MHAWKNMGCLETTKVTPNNRETGYEAAGVTVACTSLVYRCLQKTINDELVMWCAQHPTLEGVVEAVGWRSRAETGVKPTDIVVPSTINHVKRRES